MNEKLDPKDKAAEVYQKMKGFRVKNSHAKKCAIVATNELIDCLPSVNGRPPNYQDIDKFTSEYWKEVKNELIKI